MLKIIFIPLFAFLFFTNSRSAIPAPVTDVFNGGRGISFNDNWKFQKGDVGGANSISFDDAAWRKLSLPHDWSIEQSFNQSSPAGQGGGYLDGGIGWYRKTFTLPISDSGKRITIQFEGIYMNSTVWINGHLLGTRPYGYSTFEYDLTPYINTGSTSNVIAVKVNNTQPNSRWYSGSGIYRNVWLTVTDQVHVAYCGSFVTTPSVSASSADISIITRLQNHAASTEKIALATIIYDQLGNGVVTYCTAPFDIESNKETTVNYKLHVANPNLWSFSNPYLYSVITEVVFNKKVVDSFTSTLGIRSISVDPNTGFWLNDQNIKLHGVCMHHDLGSLGSAQNYRALERQVEILKSFGCNAIRTSHNPPTPELLDICDRLGLVVMDEAFDCWVAGKNTYDYHLYFNTWAQQDVQDWVRRDRNHPSVFTWSIGNEISEQNGSSGITIANKLINWVHTNDDTRPITQALNNQSILGPILDIVGYNYASGGTYDNDHTNKPNWVIMGSETSSAVRTRGVYHLPANQNTLVYSDFQCSNYDNSVVSWGHSAEDSWQFDQARPFVVGQFIWTGFDYIGEPTPYGWPAKSSYFGIVDMCGFPKDIYYFYQSQWTTKPMVHLLPHWNWSIGNTIPVWAYSNCDSVSLSINGTALGAQTLQKAKPYHAEWQVPFAEGIVKAKAYKGGAIVAMDSIVTAGLASKIKLKSDRDTIQANSYDQAFLETDILDANGILVPDAGNKISYSISGPGKIVGVDNGNPISLESFKDSTRQAFNGKCLAIIQSTGVEGQIVVTASTAPTLKNIALKKHSHADSEDNIVYTNIAAGKLSTSDSEQANNPASAGNDGSNETRWCAANANTGHWWEVDLGSIHNLTSTMIYWEKSNAYKYKIETSKNNTTWKLSVDMTGNTIVTSTIFHILEDTARYVRITITGGVNSSNWASFYEFMLYDGSFTVDNQKNVASKGNDGDLNTFWRAGDNNPGHSWVVDLGSKIHITGTQVTWIDSLNGYQYKIETSSDSSVWSLAVDKTTNTSKQQTQTDNFNDSARYVRITITGSTSYLYNPGFLEFKVFDGTYTTISPASVTIVCVKPLCVSCKIDSIRLKPWINVNNSGWMQSGSAYLCLGDDVSFSTFSSDTTGWIWIGPHGFSANKMQINLSNIQSNDTGIYKAMHNSVYFNFYVKLIKDNITPFIKINKNSYKPVDTATVITGDTVSLSPLPPDSIGWTWSWTGPNGFSATSRAIKFAINSITQAGIYTSTGTAPLDCGSTSHIFNLTVNNTGIAEISSQEVKIYPNPSHNGIFILKDCNNSKISIYNLIGENIYSKIAGSNNQIIDLTLQAKGIYVIKVFSDKINGFKKLVIQ